MNKGFLKKILNTVLHICNWNELQVMRNFVQEGLSLSIKSIGLNIKRHLGTLKDISLFSGVMLKENAQPALIYSLDYRPLSS